MRTNASLTSTKRPWGVEKNSFLNVVEKFAIAALGLAPVGDVLEHVHNLPLALLVPMAPTPRDDGPWLERECARLKSDRCAPAPDVRIRRNRRRCGRRGRSAAKRPRKRFERPHVDANQLIGGDADKIRQGPIDAKNVLPARRAPR